MQDQCVEVPRACELLVVADSRLPDRVDVEKADAFADDRSMVQRPLREVDRVVL